MKRKNATFGLLVIFAPTILMGANVKVSGKIGAGRGGIGVRAVSRAASPSVVIKMQRRIVPKPQVIKNPRNIIRERPAINVPQRDDRGVVINKRPATVAPRYHTTIVRNTTIIRNINRRQRVEVVPNRYYWHREGGVRYCHYFHNRIHWYGFYHGPSFYWTRYYGGYWWWFDVGFNRWVYWYDGYWWWPGPAGAMYVYVDNNYYPYQEGVVTVVKPEVQAPSEDVSEVGEENTYTSPDQTRLIQVVGSKHEAFLYDNSTGKPVFMKYLGQGTEKVRFAGGTEGKPLQILMDFNDGNFALFDAEGNSRDSSISPADLPPALSAPPDVDVPPDDALPPSPPVGENE